jgi:hypothetical protein
LLVEVTHSQNWFHAEAPWRCWRVVVMRTVGRVLTGVCPEALAGKR